MELANIFYILAIIVSVLFIVVLVAILILIFFIYRKVKDIHLMATTKIDSVSSFIESKLTLIPFASLLLPLIKGRFGKKK